jgi:hypothetical protein
LRVQKNEAASSRVESDMFGKWYRFVIKKVQQQNC